MGKVFSIYIIANVSSFLFVRIILYLVARGRPQLDLGMSSLSE